MNGRVFVNNVSLGVYAEAVSQEQDRESKLRALLDTLSQTLGPTLGSGRHPRLDADVLGVVDFSHL